MGNQLKSTKILEQVFEKGQKSFIFPIKIMYLKNEVPINETPQIKYTVTAPKRLFKKAVDRNRIKRQMRAAVDSMIRSDKLVLTSSFSIVLLYVAKEKLEYKIIFQSIRKQFIKLLA